MLRSQDVLVSLAAPTLTFAGSRIVSISCCRTSFSPPTLSSPTPLGVQRSTPQRDGGVNPLRACVKSLWDRHKPGGWENTKAMPLQSSFGFLAFNNYCVFYRRHCCLSARLRAQRALTAPPNLGVYIPPSPSPGPPGLTPVRFPLICSFF